MSQDRMTVDIPLLDEQILTLMERYVIANYSGLSDSHFSMTKDNPSDTELPFIYLQRIVGTETAIDLERDEFQGGLFTYEVRVTSNKSQRQAKDIMEQVTNAMKSMRFWGTSLPVISDVGNLHIMIARWQREFYDGDTIQ